jgi:antitoxin component YwqK of YwqJK toxin-antitoxin module/Tfp pilus assembly protein PilF
MKKRLSFVIILFSFLFSHKAISQNSGSDSSTSHQLVEKGILLHDEGKYEEAIALYDRISKCDPNYPWALYESALSYSALDQPETALSKCRAADDLQPGKVTTVALMGSLLDDLGKTDEAISYLTKALATWPYNQNLLYNIAVCYTRAHQPENAEEVLIRSIRINPYHKSSHLLLAKVNFYMGRQAQSYLAYNMAILLNPRVSYINEFEQALTGKLDSLSRGYDHPYPAGADHQKWDELKWLLQSEMAYNEGFDYNYKISYLTARQSLMLFRKMTYTPSDTSIYNQFYVRFYSELMKNNYFESYLNYSFKNTDNKLVADWISGNQGKLDEFISWGQSAINGYRNYGFSSANEANKETLWHYNDEGDLSSIGRQKADATEMKSGSWQIINASGWIEEIGTYVDDKLEGDWMVYWPNGKVNQHLLYHADELDGTSMTFHPTGVRAGTYTRVKGKRDGPEEKFITSGKLLSSTLYRNDTVAGKRIKYDYDEGFVQEAFYLSGKTQGKITEKWLNGNPKSEIAVKDSLYNGDFRSWYSNAKPESAGFYTNDLATGKWTNYFPNGSKSTEGWLDDKGKLTGTKLSYFHNGKIETQETPYEDGLLTGTAISYYADGTIRSKKTLKEDRLLKLECFDAKGNSLYAAEETNGLINSRTYYGDGILESEGTLKDGELDGKWTYYNPQGGISQELRYQNGFQSGKQIRYHENGVIKQEYSCDSNLIIGIFTEYYSTGHRYVTGMYDRNGRTGEWTSWFNNDSLLTKLFYAENIRVGRQFFFSPSGKMSTEEFFNDEGKSVRLKRYDISGHVRQDQKYEYDSVLFIEHYPSGVLRGKKMMVNNTPHGVVETYLPNGKLQSQKTYLYGLADGMEKRWDYNGKLILEIPYAMGVRDGLMKGYRDGKLWYTDKYEYGQSQGNYTEYYGNGRVQRSLSYVDDQKEGISDYYAPDSSFMYRLIYAENTLKAYTYKDPKGDLLPEKDVDIKMKQIQCYYPNGKLSASITLTNGVYDGDMKTYYPGGNIMQEKVFANDNFAGANKFYYNNGKLKELISYTDDDRNGRYETYYENGQIHEAGWFLADQAQGTWLVYSEAGKLVNTLYYDNDEIHDLK